MNLHDLKKLIESEFSKHPFVTDPQELSDPLNYITGLGGKRVRPLLVLSSYLCFNNSLSKEVLSLARAVEMFHNFSLIHDDIMDRSEKRRGHPTVHLKWDEATAILSGDLMLIRVYELLHEIGNLELLGNFNKMAVALCEGQMADMLFEKKEAVSKGDYLKMITGKTAVLLAFALESSAVLSNQDLKVRRTFNELGMDLGLAFQLKDDFLDSFGESEDTGKRTGQDILKRKRTYLWNFMWESLSVQDRSAIEYLYRDESEEVIIRTVQDYMEESGAKAACEKLIMHYEQNVEQTNLYIEKNHPSETLKDLLAMLGNRIK